MMLCVTKQEVKLKMHALQLLNESQNETSLPHDMRLTLHDRIFLLREKNVA